MIAPDTVVVYRIFGLDYTAFTSLIRVIVTIVIIALTIRIPFKRTYHWMFLVVSVATLAYVLAVVYTQLAPTAAAFLSRDWLNFVANSDLQALVIFQFVVYFVSRRVNLWEKLALIAGYAYVVVIFWVPLVVDQSFQYVGPIFQTVFGWQGHPGTSDPYLRPYGIDLYITVTSILSLFLLFRYYRSEKSPLMRGQTKFIIVAMVLLTAGAYALTIAKYAGGPNFQFFIAGAGDFVLLLGLRKKGFYSVTPVSESAARALPRYLLEGGRSYLVHDNREGFEAFSSLVRGGRQGLVVTRSYPEDVRKDYDLRNTPVLWLAESKGDGVIPPSDLLGLSLTVKDFLERAVEPVVILHGIEYLTAYNGFGPIYRLINGIGETNAKKRGVLILPVTPKSLDERDDALLGSETTPLPSMKAGSGPDWTG